MVQNISGNYMQSKVSVHMGAVCEVMFFSIMWRDVRRSFVPRPGPRLSCTPACSGLGPAASGR